MCYEKKNLKKFLSLAYTIFYSENAEGKKLTLNQSHAALYLGINRRSIHNYMKMLEEKQIIKKLEKKTRRPDGKKLISWAVNEYKVDFDKFEIELVINGFDLRVYEDIADDFEKYCLFSKAVTKAEQNVGFDEALVKDEVQRILLTAEERRKKKFDRLCKKHAFALSKLEELNAYYKDKGIQWIYLPEQKKRMTNFLCSTRNPEKSGDYARYDKIKEILGVEVEEFDIKSSIYNVSFGLGTGKIPSIDTDFYEVIFSHTNLKYVQSQWPKIRKSVKLLFMPLYMREGSIKYRVQTFEERKTADNLNKSDKLLVEAEAWLCEYFKVDLYTLLDEIRKAMHEVLNLKDFYKKDIFLYESDLHILVMWHLLNDYQIEVVNVYDGFYVKRGIKNFEKILDRVYKQSFEELLSQKGFEKDFTKRRIETQKAA